MDRYLQGVANKFGIAFMGVDPQLQFSDQERGGRLAMDAQPELVTISNSGIPAFLSTYIDPAIIEILIAPNKATDIVGEETKKGDWTLETSMFPVVEATGIVSSYGDYSDTGVSNVNVNWVQRQSYTYQVITQWGERELEKMGLARIDWANRQRMSCVITLNKFQNKTYFFGVEGLANYGLLNDPSLSAVIAPINQGGLVTWTEKATNAQDGGLYVYNDIQALYKQIVVQANGLVDLDMASPMTLAMSPTSQVYLTLTNQYKNDVRALLKESFPNMKIKTAPEYSTASGELVQLIVDEMQGTRTAITAFTEKLRAHPIIIRESSFRQKTSQGSWGTIIQRPFLMAGMLGV